MTTELKQIMRKVDKATDNEVERIIENIIRDISNRRGIGSEWEQIDIEIQEEIKNEWRMIIRQILNERV